MVSKITKGFGMGVNVRLKWIMQGEGAKYLGVLEGSHFLLMSNFDKLMAYLEVKLITWGNNKLLFISMVLVSNAMVLTSMWCLIACWNLNPRMNGNLKTQHATLFRVEVLKGKELQ